MNKILITFFCLLSLSQGICNDITWSFPPTTLSTANENASNPQIATDANGNLVAVWIENNLVKSRSKLLNMSWSAPSTLSTASATTPCLVCDTLGNATAVWLEAGIVKAASKSLSGHWTTEVTLSSGGAAYPALAVDSAGDVIAAWARHGNIETSTKLFAGSWSPLTIINSSNAAYPQIAIGGTGSNKTAVVVWQQTSDAMTSVASSSQPLPGFWSSAVILSDPAQNAAFANVAVDVNANATAIWYQYDVNGSLYSNVVVQSAEMPASGSWSVPVSLSAPGIRNPASLVASVAYDGIGNAIALWNTSFDDETFNIEAAVKPLRGTWSSATDIVSANLYAMATDLNVCSVGDALALYMFYNGTTFIIQSTESDITGFLNNFWSIPTLVSPGTENGFPQVTATYSGNVIHAATVWISSNGMNNQILSSTGTKLLVLPPSHLSVVQTVSNFGILKDCYNTLAWHASSDPSVVGYLIYRNGIFLEQVPANVLQITDHNRIYNASVTYGVAAINSQQTHSQIVTVNFP